MERGPRAGCLSHILRTHRPAGVCSPLVRYAIAQAHGPSSPPVPRAVRVSGERGLWVKSVEGGHQRGEASVSPVLDTSPLLMPAVPLFLGGVTNSSLPPPAHAGRLPQGVICSTASWDLETGSGQTPSFLPGSVRTRVGEEELTFPFRFKVMGQ